MAGEPVILEDRAVVSVAGPEAHTLLERLVTVETAKMTVPRHGALLTPQGKILHEFLVQPEGAETLLLDLHRSLADECVKRLTFYKLRAAVEIADRSEDFAVAAAWDGNAGLPADPRLAALGGRAILPRREAAGLENGAAGHLRRRLGLGIAELVHDFAPGEIFPHEASYDLLGGVDFDKGCYVGQEVVSRMQHRGTARKRFLPVAIEGEAPARGEDVLAEGKVIGTMGGSAGADGLALLRLDRLQEAAGAPLTCGGATLSPHMPDWLGQPGGADR